MEIVDHPSPNFDERREKLDMLVLHYTGMESGKAALARMCDAEAKVSAHYMVWEDGRIARLVPEDKRAWHAGVSSWQGERDLNSRSVGIEIVNGGHDWPNPDGSLPAYPDIQIAAVIALSREIVLTHQIPPGRIVAHSDIAPSRKIDPGEHFPWERLAKAGIGIWPDLLDSAYKPAVPSETLRDMSMGPTVKPLQAALARIGYQVRETGMYHAPTSDAVRAFQRRWLPHRVTGEADISTQERIGQVSAALATADRPAV